MLKKFVFALALCAGMVAFAQDVVYVSSSGSNEEPYDSEINAATTLGTAVAYANAQGIRTVQVLGTVNLTAKTALANVEVCGDGWDSSVLNLTADLNPGLDIGANVSVHGIKFTASGVSNPRSIFSLTADSSMVSNCWITGMNTKTSYADTEIAGHAKAGLITHCLFTNNHSNNGGGGSGNGVGMLGLEGTAIMRNSIFTGNYTDGNVRGPCDGVLGIRGSAMLENCVIYGNYTKASPGGDKDSGGSKLRRGGGIIVYSGSPVIRNCIIRNNRYPNDYMEIPGGVDIYKPLREGDFLIITGATPLIENCNVPEGQVPAGAVDCQTDDPKFTLPDEATLENRDFTIADDSPCVDAGKAQDWQMTATDFSGINDRYQGLGVDIGAFEVIQETPKSATISLSGATTGVEKYTDVTMTAGTVGLVMSEDAVCTWYTSDPAVGSPTPIETGKSVTHRFTVGTWSVYLKIANADGKGADYTACLEDIITVVPGADWYVGPNGSDDNAGDASSVPFATINKAFDKAEAGQVIRLLAGTHTVSATLTIDKPVTIEGVGDDTIVKAGGKSITVNHPEAVIAKCRLTMSSGNYLAYSLADGTIRDCWITGGAPQSSFVNVIFAMSGGVLEDCRVTNNRGGNGNGKHDGVISVAGDATVRNTLFTGNWTAMSGNPYDSEAAGAVKATPAKGKTVTFENCTFVKNTGSYAGGLSVGGPDSACAGTVVIRNSVLAGNKSPYDFEVCGAAEHCSKDLTVYLSGTGVLALENVFLGTAPTGLGEMTDTSLTTVGAVGYADELNADYSIVPGSPAFGYGYHAASRGDDFSAAVALPAVDRAIGSLATTLEARLYNAPGGAATYEWDLDGDGEYETTDKGASFDYVFETPGWNRVGVRVTIGSAVAEQQAANLVYVVPERIYMKSSGSMTFPYDTEEKAARTMSDALTAVIPGATIEVVGSVSGGSFEASDLAIVGSGYGTSVFPCSNIKLYSNVSITGVTLKGPGTNNGAGIYAGSDSIAFTNCCITGFQNSSGGTPGGIYTGGDYEGCFFKGCCNNGDSGVYSFSGSATVRNCVFTKNYFKGSLGHLGVVYLKDNVIFENNVVYDNYATAAGSVDSGAGINVVSGSPVIRNSIVRNNRLASGEADFVIGGAALPTIERCNIAEGQVPSGATDCQVGDPLFVNPATEDFSLQGGSPCLDKGLYFPWQATSSDFAGMARFQGFGVDIGACESARPTPVLTIATDKAKYYGAQEVTLTAASANETELSPDFTYLWMVNGVEQDETSATLVKYLETGVNEISVVVRGCGYFAAAKTVDILEIPGVDFTTEEVVGLGEKDVTFTPRGTGSLVLDEAATFAWFINDAEGAGEPFSTERNPSWHFGEPGEYDILLKVANADGAGGAYEKLRRSCVVVIRPAVSMTLSETTGEGRTPIVLTASSAGFDFAEDAVYEWRWTDLSGETPDVTGNPAVGDFVGGTWSVRLTVKNADGKGLELSSELTDVVSIIPGADFYVSPAGSDDGLGTKKSPFATLKKAAASASAGQKIKIAGLISEDFYVTLNGVELYGDDRDSSGVAIATAAAAGYITLGPGAFVHDLKISGSRNDGGVVRLTDDTAVVSNCWISGNYYTTRGNPGGGFSAGLVTHTLFSDNHCNYGPVFEVTGTARIRNCVFKGNYINGTEDGKTAFSGLLAVSGSAVFENNTVCGNYAALPTLGSTQLSAGLYVSGGTPTIRNNIVWGNRINGSLATGSVGNFYLKGGEPSMRRNCSEEGFGELAVTGDPLLGDDLKPLRGSSCIDAGYGRGWRVGATDASGVSPRLRGCHVDIGAYEFDNGADSAMMILVK